MNRQPPKTHRAVEFLPVLVLALCVLLVALIHIDPGYPRYARAINSFFILQPDNVVEEAIPGHAGIRRIYTFTLPESDSAMATGSGLFFYLRHTFSQFQIEGSTLKNDHMEEAAPHIGHTPGNYWVSIPMHPAYAGKTLQVTLTPAYCSVRNETPTFMIIRRDALLTMLELPRDSLLLTLGLLCVLSGAFLVLFAMFLPLTAHDRRRIICLGAVAVTAGLWKLCSLPTLMLMLDYWGLEKEIWYTGAASYILMLVLSLRLAGLLRSEGDDRPGMLCFYISIGSAVLVLTLQLFGVVDLHEVLIGYGVSVCLLHLISLLAQRPTRSEILWFLLFVLTPGIDLAIYYVRGALRTAPVFLSCFLFNLFVRGFDFVREAIHREHELRRKEGELRDIKIQSMMNQIRPHFIFNTLTTIYVLCRDDPTLAMQVIQDFTTYLHANFTAFSATDPIAFSEELAHTKAYIAVESLRYGDRLHVTYDIRHSSFRIPALTLQPLVENAVKHCLGKGIYPEHIQVSTRAEEGYSVIVVSDDGPGIKNDAGDSEAHVGLQNVRQRLELMCGGTLRADSADGRGTIITVKIPQSAPSRT